MVSFEEFMLGLSDTNATLNFFTDFEKVNKNVAKISMKLNQLNYLIGKEDIKSAIFELYEENSKVFEVLDILIAIRTKDKKKVINEKGDFVLLEEYFKTPEKIYEYIKETGLENIFKAKEIKNLVDYVFGIEVGLDTNARKNRTGTFMEKAVAKIFEKNNIEYRREVYATEFPELTSLGDDLKRFDFVVVTKKKTYLIEVNFYSAGGSKLNETARAYTDIAPKINQYSEYEFVWITDGKGWEKSKSKLKEAYQNIDKVYNLQTIINFISILKK